MEPTPILARIEQAFEAAAKSAFTNHHGITPRNLGAFRVSPYEVVVVDDDDGSSCKMWVVLQEAQPLGSRYAIAFDPLTDAWAVIEAVERNDVDHSFSLVIQATSLAMALDGM